MEGGSGRGVDEAVTKDFAPKVVVVIHLLVTSDQVHTTDANSLVAHKADLARFTTKHWISRRVGSKPRRLSRITVPPTHKTSAGKSANRS